MHAQLEHLQAKHVGTGHADTTKLYRQQPRTHETPSLDGRKCGGRPSHRLLTAKRPASLARVRDSEWGVNQHRDSLALYVGFDSLSQYIAVAENESLGRVRFSCLQVHARTAPAPRRCLVCSHKRSDCRRQPSRGVATRLLGSRGLANRAISPP